MNLSVLFPGNTSIYKSTCMATEIMRIWHLFTGWPELCNTTSLNEFYFILVLLVCSMSNCISNQEQ